MWDGGNEYLDGRNWTQLPDHELNNLYESIHHWCIKKRGQRYSWDISLINDISQITYSRQKNLTPKWTIIHYKTEGFDAVSIARCEKNLSEVQAILLIEEKNDNKMKIIDKNKSKWREVIEILDWLICIISLLIIIKCSWDSYKILDSFVLEIMISWNIMSLNSLGFAFQSGWISCKYLKWCKISDDTWSVLPIHLGVEVEIQNSSWDIESQWDMNGWFVIKCQCPSNGRNPISMRGWYSLRVKPSPHYQIKTIMWFNTYTSHTHHH